MKVCVMGAGVVGGCLGARLAAAGHDVAFIARGAHLAALQESGLRLANVRGDVEVANAVATDKPASVGLVDLVLFTVKMRDCAAAAEQCRHLVGSETVVVTMLNGVESHEVLCDWLRRGPVLGATA